MLPQVLKYIDILKISSYGMSKETYESVHRGHIKYEQSMANIMQLLNEKERPYTIGLLVETDLNKDERDEWIRFWEPRLDEVFVWKPHNWVDYRSYREMDRSCQRTCGRPLNGPLYIHVDGTVSPCCWDINKRMVIGDINRQTIYEIIHSEVFAKIRHAHEMNNFSDLICCNCCQTNHRDDVLIYTNKGRQVGELTPNNIRLIKK